MASRPLSILGLDQMLSVVIDVTLLLSEGESCEEEGEGMYANTSKPSVDPGDVVALSKAVTNEIALLESAALMLVQLNYFSVMVSWGR